MSRKNNITYEQHIPLFLKKYHNDIEENTQLLNNKHNMKEERGDKIEELPSISNLEEYKYEIQNNLIIGLDSKNIIKNENDKINKKDLKESNNIINDINNSTNTNIISSDGM